MAMTTETPHTQATHQNAQDEDPSIRTELEQPQAQEQPAKLNHIRSTADLLQAQAWTNLFEIFTRPTADKQAATIRIVEQAAANIGGERNATASVTRHVAEAMQRRDADDFRPERIVQTYTSCFRTACGTCASEQEQAA